MHALTTQGELLNKARLVVDRLERNFMGDAIQLGALLYEIRETRAWSEGYESFDNPEMHNFLEDIGLAKQLANKIILIHERFTLKGYPEQKLLQATWAKVAETLPYAKGADEEVLDELVDVAITAPTQTELRRTLKEKYKPQEPIDCQHLETRTLNLCVNCNQRV